MRKKESSAGEGVKKYYTLDPIQWDSYESKCIRNSSAFETGFIRESKKQPDKLMVYPVEREISNKKQVSYYLVEHSLKGTEKSGGYSKYIMECMPLYEVELVKKSKEGAYGTYRKKEVSRKTVHRKIKQSGTPVTRILL